MNISHGRDFRAGVFSSTLLAFGKSCGRRTDWHAKGVRAAKQKEIATKAQCLTLAPVLLSIQQFFASPVGIPLAEQPGTTLYMPQTPEVLATDLSSRSLADSPSNSALAAAGWQAICKACL